MLSTEWFDGTYDAILLVHHSYFTTHVLPTVFGIDPPHHPNPLQPHDQHNHNHNQKNPNHSSTDSFLSEVKSFSRHLLTDDTDQPSPPAETTEKHAEKRGKDKENGNGVGNRPGSSGRGHGKEEKDARVHKEESGHRSPLLGHEGPAAVAAGKESRMSTSVGFIYRFRIDCLRIREMGTHAHPLFFFSFLRRTQNATPQPEAVATPMSVRPKKTATDKRKRKRKKRPKAWRRPTPHPALNRNPSRISALLTLPPLPLPITLVMRLPLRRQQRLAQRVSVMVVRRRRVRRRRKRIRASGRRRWGV
ncbi:uncharacterized protein EV422DRAFT_368132 [Fimicolochytrium jonesii]|uniref:uncharacterized protein n=1 Tax=Fimicolochytrium jonesii TaxID=1396493 RepID=UPI0022FF1A4D|nr:uncharacterized protein EV422DRAFT_368132 [Fimicolochytrium jonesii]KAI8823736.1 hypothetical protein EV422DRAFT_368132 [Fimicolochytrium jonesii]